MSLEHLFLVGTNAVANTNPEVMYTKLVTAGAIILMLLIIKFSSNKKIIHHG